MPLQSTSVIKQTKNQKTVFQTISIKNLIVHCGITQIMPL